MPTFYVLHTEKTQQAYESIFFSIMKLMGIRFRPEFVIGDFELALRNAAHNIFSHYCGSTWIGCTFHLCQAVQKWLSKHHGLIDAAIAKGAFLHVAPQPESDEQTAIPSNSSSLSSSSSSSSSSATSSSSSSTEASSTQLEPPPNPPSIDPPQIEPAKENDLSSFLMLNTDADVGRSSF